MSLDVAFQRVHHNDGDDNNNNDEAWLETEFAAYLRFRNTPVARNLPRYGERTGLRLPHDEGRHAGLASRGLASSMITERLFNCLSPHASLLSAPRSMYQRASGANKLDSGTAFENANSSAASGNSREAPSRRCESGTLVQAREHVSFSATASPALQAHNPHLTSETRSKLTPLNKPHTALCDK